MALLEDPDEHAVGGADREQVEHDRLDRDHDRAEREQEQQEREAEHEREHDRRPRAHRRGEVGVARRLARDRVAARRAAARAPPGRRPCRSVVQRVRPTARPRPCPTSGISTCATVWSRIDDGADRLLHDAGRERTSPQVGECRSRAARSVDVGRAGRRPSPGVDEPGNACWIAVVRLHDRQAARQVAEADQLQVHAERRQREHDEQRRRADRGRRPGWRSDGRRTAPQMRDSCPRRP